MKEGDFKCMSDMHSSHKHFSFPQDGTYTTFSSTCLYWRPKPESPTPTEKEKKEVTAEVPAEIEEKTSETATDSVSVKVPDNVPDKSSASTIKETPELPPS